MPPALAAPTEEQVPALRTPITAEALYQGLARAWPVVVESTPTRKALLLLLAQSALETGHWQKGSFNFNLANVRHFPGDGFNYHTIQCEEILNGRKVVGPCAFRAYSTLDQGAVDYLSLLYRKYRFAWPALLAGDAATFAKRLKQGKYFTADEQAYASQLRALASRYDKAIEDAAPAVVASAYDRSSYTPNLRTTPLGDSLWLFGLGALGVAVGTYGMVTYGKKAF